MLSFPNRKLIISVAVLLVAFSALQAQTLSGYTGSTSAKDGYNGRIKKVTITQADISGTEETQSPVTTTEIEYDAEGRRVSVKNSGHTTKYAYSKDSFTTTTDGYVTAKATFFSDGNLKEYITYKSSGSIIRKDTYTRGSDGKITSMERTDGQGKTISSWTYTTDRLGNTVIKTADGSSSYTFNPSGVLVKEFIADSKNSWSERIYDEYGFEAAMRIFSFPDSGMIMQRDIPTTEISYTTEYKLDEQNRIKEIETGKLTKQYEKWYNEDGKYVSSEERRNGNITLTWLSYRYDGNLAEIYTEHWQSPTEGNPTGYSSNTDTYFYNNEAALTQIVSYDETGSEKERIVFTYDDDGNLFLTEAENEPNEKNYYSWNASNQMTSKLCCIEDDSLFYAGMEEYSYNEDGTTAKTSYTQIWRIIMDDMPKKTTQFSSKAESLFFYDQNGLLRKKETEYDDRKETEFYDYDEEGRAIILSVLTEYPNNTILYGEKTYKYEEDVDYTGMTEFDSLHTKKVYTYNAAGNISSIKEYEIQFIDGTYTDTLYSVTTYTYN